MRPLPTALHRDSGAQARSRLAPRRTLLALRLCALLAPPTLHAAQTPDGADATTLQTVEVTAQAGGTTAAATRLDLSPRETPQSLSIAGRELIEDFALNDINDVLALTTGIDVQKVETERTYYSARGFDITNFQFDGVGLPFASGQQVGRLDTVLYERIEVLRGANGLGASVGNPSATVNFVRKRPTREFQGSAALGVGSWNNHRVEADLSGALDAGGRVRGRVVAAYQHGDSYLDRYSLEKAVGSGIVEADLGERTLLALGLSYQKNRPRGSMWGALPLYYADGTPTDYDASTSTATRWSGWGNTDTWAFAELTRGLGGGWRLKASLNHRELDGGGDLFYVYGTPERDTGRGLYSYPSYYRGRNEIDQAVLAADGAFALGGREHELALGLDWARNDVGDLSRYTAAAIGVPLPEPAGWNGTFPRPDFADYSSGGDYRIRRGSAYASARWNLGEALKLITGANRVRIDADGESYGTAYAYDEARTLPFAGLVYDLDRRYSLYASYAEIFNPQTEVDADRRPLDPIDGRTWETGVKGEWSGGALNASFALFRTEQNNTAESAGFDPDTGQEYFRGVDATATGYELDLGGRLGERWDLYGGFTQLRLEGGNGEDVRAYVPRRTLRLAAAYRVPGADGLKLGASLKWQDAIHRDQDATATDGGPVVTRQGSYALLGLMARYDFDERWSATLNLDNLTDRKYLTSLYWAQSYYGAPRNATLTVRYRF